MNGFYVECAIAEFEWTFVASATSREVSARKQPTWPGNDELLNLITPGTRGRTRCRNCFAVIFRDRQFAPSGNNFGGRIAQRRFGHHLPDMLGEPESNALTRRQILQRDVGFTQGRAMFVLPRGIQSLPVPFQAKWSAAFTRDGAETVGSVNVPDPRNRREFKAGLARMREKFERARPDHSVIGNDLGGTEVSL